MYGSNSITRRIIGFHILAVVVTSIILPLALYLMLKSAAEDLHHRSLIELIDDLKTHIRASEDGSVTVDLPAEIRPMYSNTYGRYSYAIFGPNGKVIESTSSAGQSNFAGAERCPQDRLFSFNTSNRQYFGLCLPLEIGKGPFSIQVIEDMSHRDVLIDDIVADFFKAAGWVTIPAMLLLLMIDIFIFRRALDPLTQASAMTRTITPLRTDVRLPTKHIPVEILPLVEAVNSAFDRLDQGFRTQRDFTADAAHELRTPLAILQAKIDTLVEPGLAKSMQRDIAGMARILNQLLEIAELEDISKKPQEPVDLLQVCSDVVEENAPLALQAHAELGLDGAKDPVFVFGNYDALYRAIRNLVENAIFHTQSGTKVDVCVSPNGSVSVLDRGPGVPKGERELIFKRFWRRDRQDGRGTGLGLSMVQKVADTSGATVSVNNRDGGGACFCLQFQLASSASSRP